MLLGWNPEARALTHAIGQDPAHPFRLIGVVTLARDSEPPFTETAMAAPFSEMRATFVTAGAGQTDVRVVQEPGMRSIDHRPALLGSVAELPALLARHSADLLIITRLDLPRAELQEIVETCERAYVEWKIIPSGFDIFLSGLRLQTIGRVPVLGIDELTIKRLFNRGLKRAIDVTGAMVGLILSWPIVLVFAILIKRESPGGPVFFTQQRIGSRHRPFKLWKLRSMVPEAAASDGSRQSTARNDPRLLRIGGFMRRWNLDELPQFWNVLRGDMSLVGPRPERPLHVDRLSGEIPHYLPRHIVRPGMTGWAQVNGLRGDSDLTARVQHDIFYIENWSVWLDIQILLLTFVRWKNAY
jgi:exopolysaccharide biosynthesis polyprenyl glycosylphosphotransferase